MKTSNVIASVLFGSLAVAAPLNHKHHKRALHTVTSTLVQTEIVYTTVYAGEASKATSSAVTTSSPAAFFEKSSTKAAAPTSVKTSAVAAPSSAKPSSVKPSSAAPIPTIIQTSALVAQPTSTKAPTTTAAPAKPTTTAAPIQPATTAAAPKPTIAPPSSGSGQVHSGGSMTLNNFAGNLGSCGKPIADTEMTVALASDLYGASTYDVATGNPTNKWCGQKVAITYKGKTTTATIMDKCDGCTNGGFDMTPSLWEAVTGTSVGDRITGMTWTTV